METRKHKITNWNKLVKEIYRNRNKNCPHRVKLQTVLRSASQIYCKGSENDDSYKYDGTESGWIRLVKTILHNSTCRKFHKTKLIKVLRRASKAYCKETTGQTRKTRRRKSVPASAPVPAQQPAPEQKSGILASFGLA
jgi:hypothetical protein